MKRTLMISPDLEYHLAFVRHCADRVDLDPVLLAQAKCDLADAVLRAVDARTARRLDKLVNVKLRPAVVVDVRLTPKRRRA